MRVVFLSRVRSYFGELAHILYEKEYFSFRDSAYKYVDELFVDIKTNLPVHVHKPAPKYFDKYGRGLYYAVFKKNKHTQYYAFFSKYYDGEEIVYQVRYITNNHVAAHHL